MKSDDPASSNSFDFSHVDLDIKSVDVAASHLKDVILATDDEQFTINLKPKVICVKQPVSILRRHSVGVRFSDCVTHHKDFSNLVPILNGYLDLSSTQRPTR